MKILISGDFCPVFRCSDMLEQCQYDKLLSHVRQIIKQTDYSIVNLECPITTGSSKPIPKCGPNLRTSEKTIELLKYAGFKAVTLANNHFLDYGETGVKDTLVALDNNGINHVGGGINLSDASKTMTIVGDCGKIAIINCCEHEFSIATEKTPGSNPLNPIQQWYAIREAKKQADFVIVIVHGGHEHYQLPSPRMQETYRFFIDSGADAVINHHQHCYSGYEYYNERPIVYGLGNFLFDWNGRRNAAWNEGYMAILTLTGSNVNLETIPYNQCGENPCVVPLEDRTNFDDSLAKLNAIIADPKLLKSKHIDWMEKSKRTYRSSLIPYSNKYMKALNTRGLLPSFITKERVERFINYIDCESHRENMLYMLNGEIHNNDE